MSQMIEYGAYIIDLTDAMLEHRQGLNHEQIQRLQMMNRRAVDFVTTFLQHENASAPTLLNYLNHDAQNPLRIIMACSQMLISGNCGQMLPDYTQGVQEIFDCVCAIVEDVQQMRMDLQNFMETIGIMD